MTPRISGQLQIASRVMGASLPFRVEGLVIRVAAVADSSVSNVADAVLVFRVS